MQFAIHLLCFQLMSLTHTCMLEVLNYLLTITSIRLFATYLLLEKHICFVRHTVSYTCTCDTYIQHNISIVFKAPIVCNTQYYGDYDYFKVYTMIFYSPLHAIHTDVTRAYPLAFPLTFHIALSGVRALIWPLVILQKVIISLFGFTTRPSTFINTLANASTLSKP